MQMTNPANNRPVVEEITGLMAKETGRERRDDYTD